MGEERLVMSGLQSQSPVMKGTTLMIGSPDLPGVLKSDVGRIGVGV
jgi:hypothetical protein